MPAISISWGPWGEIGMAVNLMNRNLIGGIRALTPALGLDLLEQIIRADMGRPIVANLDWSQWLNQYGTTRNTSLFSDFRDLTPRDNPMRSVSAIRQKIDLADPSARQELIASFMTAELARVLQVDISRIDVNSRLDTVGLDSLMAVEYKVRLETGLGFTLPIVRLLNGPTIAEISAFVAEALNTQTATDTAAIETASTGTTLATAAESGSDLSPAQQVQEAAT